MKNKMKKIAMLNIVAMAAIIVGIVGVCATTIQVVTITYQLASTQSVTSDTVSADYNYQTYLSKPTLKYASSQQGNYLEVTAQRKGLFGIYSNKASYKFMDPVVGVQAESSTYSLETGTYRYKLYDYSMERLEGTVTVNIRN